MQSWMFLPHNIFFIHFRYSHDRGHELVRESGYYHDNNIRGRNHFISYRKWTSHHLNRSVISLFPHFCMLSLIFPIKELLHEALWRWLIPLQKQERYLCDWFIFSEAGKITLWHWFFFSEAGKITLWLWFIFFQKQER